jgi:4-hydroxy-tetrahydrodipicolinate synthase
MAAVAADGNRAKPQPCSAGYPASPYEERVVTMFAGVIPILATPFYDDDRLDLESWQRLLDFMVVLGVDGITILGVLGESNRLNDEERQTLIETAVAVIARRVPIIVGASATGTRTAVSLASMAQDLGANAVMVTPAKEAVPNDDRVFELYQHIAQNITIPIVLQDHPASTDVHMSVGLILRILRAFPAVGCVKEEAVPTAPKIRQMREGLPERRVPILSGLGALYAPFDLEAGSDGFNTGFAFPEVLQALVAAARQGDWSLIHHIYSRFAALIVFEQQPGVAVRKELLRRRGLLASARVRHPGATISAAQSAQLEALLARTLPGVDITRPIASHELLPA